MLANQSYGCTSVCVYVCACGVSVWEQGHLADSQIKRPVLFELCDSTNIHRKPIFTMSYTNSSHSRYSSFIKKENNVIYKLFTLKVQLLHQEGEQCHIQTLHTQGTAPSSRRRTMSYTTSSHSRYSSFIKKENNVIYKLFTLKVQLLHQEGEQCHIQTLHTQGIAPSSRRRTMSYTNSSHSRYSSFIKKENNVIYKLFTLKE